jgi:hypothetical protein
MLKPVEADFKQAATASSRTFPNDPIANSFAQYQAFAQLRCSAVKISPPSTTVATATTSESSPVQEGSVSLAPTTTKTPNLVLTKWVDNAGVVRTRNWLNDAASQERFSEIQSRTRRIEREMHRALDLLVNKDDIREHLLLDPGTVEALRYYASGDHAKFQAVVLSEKIVTSDMLIKIGRGPIFEDWMIKQLIFDAVMKSAVDFDKASADNAVAATAHFM